MGQPIRQYSVGLSFCIECLERAEGIEVYSGIIGHIFDNSCHDKGFIFTEFQNLADGICFTEASIGYLFSNDNGIGRRQCGFRVSLDHRPCKNIEDIFIGVQNPVYAEKFSIIDKI